jgi:outer membrane protein
MKFRVMGISIIILFLVVPMAMGETQLKVAYVDFQKALEQCQKGKEAKQKLQNWFKEKQELINRKQEELRKLQEEISKQSMLLKDEVRFQKQQEYQTKLRDFQRLFNDAQEEMRQEEIKLTRPILAELAKIVEEIGEKEGYTFIFLREQSGLIFATPKLDITQKVVEIYDNRTRTKAR